MFDVVVVDFPDPTNFSLGKLYTTALLRAARAPPRGGRRRGGADAPRRCWRGAASGAWSRRSRRRASRPRRTTRTCRRFGEWGFVLASRGRALGRGRCLPPGLRFLTRRRPAGAASLPARHGARPARGQPPVQPGAGALLRGGMGQGPPLGRRALLAATLGAPGLAGLWPPVRAASRRCDGGWIGARRRVGIACVYRPRLPAPAASQRADVLVVGAGIAGLAAARASSARASTTSWCWSSKTRRAATPRAPSGRQRLPEGAHYLPLPVPDARGAAAARDLGVLQATGRRRPRYDERPLCCAPQERIFRHGAWHEGLFRARGRPPPSATLAAVPRRMERSAPARREAAARSPSRWPLSSRDARLPRSTACRWATGWPRGLHVGPVRWLVDYACRDDYGSDCRDVSAWAGVHYFASRDAHAENGGDVVLTWPEGNGWLVRRLPSVTVAVTVDALVYRLEERPRGVGLEAYLDARGPVDRARRRARRMGRPVCDSPARTCRRRSGLRGARRIPLRALAGGQPARSMCAARTARRAAGLGQRAVRQRGARLRRRHAPDRRAPPPDRAHLVPPAVRMRAPCAGRLFVTSCEAWGTDPRRSVPPASRPPPTSSAGGRERYGHAMVRPRPGFVWGDARRRSKRTPGACILRMPTQAASRSSRRPSIVAWPPPSACSRGWAYGARPSCERRPQCR